MFFSKDLNGLYDALNTETPTDIWIPFNAGRRTGIGRETLSRKFGDFSHQPPPNSVNLKDWISTNIGTGTFSGAKSTYLLSPNCYITSFGTSVTMNRSVGSISIVCPSTNRLEGVQITGTSADMNPDGTFTILVNLGASTLNNGYTSLFRPYSFEVYDESNQANGGPSTSFPFVVDDSINTVQKEIVGCSGGVLTLRVSNLQVYEKWTIVLAF